jgi:hypothetical protein
LFEVGLKVEAALAPASIFLRGPGLFKERDCVAELPGLVAIEEITGLFGESLGATTGTLIDVEDIGAKGFLGILIC